MDSVLASLASALTSPSTALPWVARLVAVAVLVASFELVVAWSRMVGDDGLLPWALVRRDHERLAPAVRALLDLLLGARGFVVVVVARVFAAVALLVSPERAGVAAVVAAVVALFTSVVVSVRFRGRENGASDALTNLVLLALAVAAVARALGVDVDGGAVVFVAAQALLSYVAAGIAKLRSPSWRRGRALAAFVAAARFGAPAWAKRTLERRVIGAVVGAVVGFVVVAWELASPLALTSTTACFAFCAAGLVFHLANFAVFGLNRFVFAWLATYPALLACAASLSR